MTVFYFFYKDWLPFSIFFRVMLTSTLKALVNNLFWKKFDTTFMGNKKNYQNINFFSIKTFIKWIINQFSKCIC